MGNAGGVKSSGRRNSPSSDSRANSGEVGLGLRGKGLRELPGCSAVLLRGFAGVEAQRGGVSAAEQRSGGTAELGAARRARVWGG